MALRQFPSGGLLDALAGAGNNAAAQPTNIMEDMAMNVSMPIFCSTIVHLIVSDDPAADRADDLQWGAGEHAHGVHVQWGLGADDDGVHGRPCHGADDQRVLKVPLFQYQNKFNLSRMMTEIMRPPTEEETAMMMSLVEEMMQMPSDEQMAEMEQGNLIKYFGIYFIFITLD